MFVHTENLYFVPKQADSVHEPRPNTPNTCDPIAFNTDTAKMFEQDTLPGRSKTAEQACYFTGM